MNTDKKTPNQLLQNKNCSYLKENRKRVIIILLSRYFCLDWAVSNFQEWKHFHKKNLTLINLGS